MVDRNNILRGTSIIFEAVECAEENCTKKTRIGSTYCYAHFKEQDDVSYGSLNDEISKKISMKYDPIKAADAQRWIEDVLKKKFKGTLYENLKTGHYLCEVLNAIKPKTVKKIYYGTQAFKNRENISKYLNSCVKLGMRDTDLFVTKDLYEGENMVVVIDNIFALSSLSRHPSINYKGPILVEAVYILRTKATLGQKVEAEAKLARHKKSLKAKRSLKMQKDIQKTMQMKMRKNFRPKSASFDLKPKKSKALCKIDDCTRKRHIGKDVCIDHYKAKDSISFGMQSDINKKIRARESRDEGTMEEVKEWIQAVLGEELKEETLQQSLKSGVILCRLINTIKPKRVKKVHKLNSAFKHRENISNYLKACKKLGQRPGDCFDVQDLYEGRNMVTVLNQILGLGGIARSMPEFKGPYIGVSGVNNDTRLDRYGRKSTCEGSAPFPLKMAPIPKASAQEEESEGETRFCSECGHEKEQPDAVFCESCGKKYDSDPDDY